MTTAALQLLTTHPWAICKQPTVAVTILGTTTPCILSTDRFGRKFIPFSYLLREARLGKRTSEAELAKLLGKDRSLVCKLESPNPDKVHASATLVIEICIGMGMDPLESHTAYMAEIRPEYRAIAYPDDPGPGGRAFGLPLPGFQTRLTTPRPR